MGLFSKKPDVWKEVFDEYSNAVRAWCQQLIMARHAGADISTASAIATAAGPAPQLAVQRLSGSYERDRTIATARAWLNTEAGRLSRADLIEGRSEDFWQETVGYLYSNLPVPSY